MFLWNQFLGGLLSYRQNAAHAAFTGLFCIRRLEFFLFFATEPLHLTEI
jgi:hypothetical protein